MTNYDIINDWEDILSKGDAPIGEHWGVSVTTKLAKETFDMLKRQKAEIERYEKTIGVLSTKDDGTVVATLIGNKTEYIPNELHQTLKNMAVNRAKSEVIKEFAERLKEKADRGFWQEHSYIDVEDIDNLVKEMVGE